MKFEIWNLYYIPIVYINFYLFATFYFILTKGKIISNHFSRIQLQLLLLISVRTFYSVFVFRNRLIDVWRTVRSDHCSFLSLIPTNKERNNWRMLQKSYWGIFTLILIVPRGKTRIYSSLLSADFVVSFERQCILSSKENRESRRGDLSISLCRNWITLVKTKSAETIFRITFLNKKKQFSTRWKNQNYNTIYFFFFNIQAI